jgi:hypothetical protein
LHLFSASTGVAECIETSTPSAASMARILGQRRIHALPRNKTPALPGVFWVKDAFTKRLAQTPATDKQRVPAD